MAESSIFWSTNGTGDGTSGGYTVSQLTDWLRALFCKSANLGGVSPDYQNKLAVTGTASPVSVATGSAVVTGIPYFNTAIVTVAIPTPGSSTRIDRIVLRAAYAAQTVRITRIAGTEGGGVPAMTQTAGTTWDIPLATVSITTAGVITVTDAREWLSVVPDAGVTSAKIASAAVGTAQVIDANITTVKIADANVTTAKITDANVTTAKLADGAVTSAKIATGGVGSTQIAGGGVLETNLADSAVTTNKLASGAVTSAKIASNAVAEANLADGAVATAKLAAGAVSATKIADGSIVDAKLGAGAVSTGKIADGAVTGAKLADGAVTYGKIGSNAIVSTNINTGGIETVNLNDGIVSTIKIGDGAVTLAKLATGAVSTVKLADDAVDDTKVGSRVPQFYRRKGGSATNWCTTGTTNYTPGAVRMQAGSANIPAASSPNITFPVAFSNVPIVIISQSSQSTETTVNTIASYITNTDFQVYNPGAGAITIHWLAIGDE